MKLQGVIFDLDGVITDTAHLHFQAWQQIAAEIGISIDAQFNEFLKGISRDESLRRILQHGGKEGDFNPQERAQLAYRKNLLYVHSLRELTVNAVLPGIHNLLVDLRAQQIPVGLASVSLNAPASETEHHHDLRDPRSDRSDDYGDADCHYEGWDCSAGRCAENGL